MCLQNSAHMAPFTLRCGVHTVHSCDHARLRNGTLCSPSHFARKHASLHTGGHKAPHFLKRLCSLHAVAIARSTANSVTLSNQCRQVWCERMYRTYHSVYQA